MRLKKLPIIFYSLNNKNYYSMEHNYKLIYTEKLLDKYKIFKNFYFIMFYSDLVMLDKNFLLDLNLNKKSKIYKYLEINKKNFLFFLYNNKIYNLINLLNLIKYYTFNYSKIFYFLNFKYFNLHVLKLLVYIKKKCQL